MRMRSYPPTGVPPEPARALGTRPPAGVAPVEQAGTAPGLPDAFQTLGARFWPRVSVGAGGERCWLMTGLQGTQVPPYFSVAGRQAHAVRIAWELSGRGPLWRVTLRATCDNGLCIRPSHRVAQAQIRGTPRLGLAEMLGLPGAHVAADTGALLLVDAATPAPVGVSHARARTPDALRPLVTTPGGSTSGGPTAGGTFTLADLLALLGTPTAVVGTTKDGLTIVATPWGRFDHADPWTALSDALRAFHTAAASTDEAA